MAYIGTYNQLGYTISDGKTGEEIYTAGNCPGDSRAIVPLNQALPLKTIKEYCAQTGSDLAAEAGTTYMGSEYEPDDDEDEDAYDVWASEAEEH